MTNLVTNIVINLGGVIATNTPAFKAYALSLLLTQANFFATTLNLQTPRPITTNDLTSITINATTNGLAGGIRINNRYAIGIADQKVIQFEDFQYEQHSFYGKDEQSEALLKMTNVLTLKSAGKLAENALHKIGINEKETGIGKMVTLKQWKYDWDGKMYDLPLYEVRWKTDEGVVLMEISGVTSNVVSFFQITRAPKLRVPIPTNYYEMLGLASNVVFIKNQSFRNPNSESPTVILKKPPKSYNYNNAATNSP